MKTCFFFHHLFFYSGRYEDQRDSVEQLRSYLKEQMAKHKILNGFVDVLVTNDIYEGINALMQTSGVGGFRPNTVNAKFFLNFLGSYN